LLALLGSLVAVACPHGGGDLTLRAQQQARYYM
jgi:hypothetical protein